MIQIRLFIFFILVVGFASVSVGSSWDLNDVTILYPLPNLSLENSTANMISFTDTETGAVFMDPSLLFRDYMKNPSENFIFAFSAQALPEINMKADDVFKAFRAIGVRFDPCFRDTFADQCRPQIRLTWQPIISYKNTWVGLDTALHSFYDFSELEWSSLVTDLNRLRQPYHSLTKGKPLQPHPVLVKEGLNGPFGKGLRQIVEKYAGHRKPTRVTFMNVIGEFHADGAPTTVWDFRMAEIDSKGNYFFKQNPLVLNSGVAGENSFESVQNNSADGLSFDAKIDTGFTIATLKSGIENLLGLIKDSVAYGRRASKQDIIHDYQMTLRIQQPSFHQATTTDCVSCHLSTATQSWFERNLSQGQVATARKQFDAIWANTKFDLTNISTYYGSTRNVRALGYLSDTPAISNRVIYESANVANSLNNVH